MRLLVIPALTFLYTSSQVFAASDEDGMGKRDSKGKVVVESERENSEEVSSDGPSTVRFSIGLGVNGLTTYRAKTVRISGPTAGDLPDSEFDLDFHRGASLNLEGKYNYRPHSWGVLFGVWYDFVRKSEEGHLKVDGTTATFDTDQDPAKLSQLVVYVSAMYRWESIYFQLGLNANSVNYDEPSSTGSTTTAKGGLGMQLGFGGEFSRDWGWDVAIRVTALDLETEISDGGNLIDYGTGYVGNWYFGAHYNL